MRIAFISVLFLFLASCGELSQEQKATQTTEITRSFAQASATIPAPTIDGLAIMIVVDVSGSMSAAVMDSDNTSRSKLEIAKKNVRLLVEKTISYATTHPERKILLGITAFSGSCVEVLAPSVPNLAEANIAIEALSGGGGTAIGDAMIFAKRRLDQTSYSKLHIVTVTDGENGSGHDPEAVVIAFAKMEPAPAMYLIGFDISANRFERVKQAGCLVIGANDGAALQQTLSYVFDNKILAEKEEPETK